MIDWKSIPGGPGFTFCRQKTGKNLDVALFFADSIFVIVYRPIHCISHQTYAWRIVHWSSRWSTRGARWRLRATLARGSLARASLARFTLSLCQFGACHSGAMPVWRVSLWRVSNLCAYIRPEGLPFSFLRSSAHTTLARIYFAHFPFWVVLSALLYHRGYIIANLFMILNMVFLVAGR